METDQKELISVERLSGPVREEFDSISQNDTPQTKTHRRSAIQRFAEQGFPGTKQEDWRFTDLKETLGRSYDYYLEPRAVADIQKVFRCDIPHLDTAVIAQLNGWYVSKDVPLMELGNGIIMGSLAEAMKKYPATR